MALIKKTLASGTTTALYFASIFLESTQLLADLLEEYVTV